MQLDRVPRAPELPRDLLVAAPVGQPLEDRALPLGQPPSRGQRMHQRALLQRSLGDQQHAFFGQRQRLPGLRRAALERAIEQLARGCRPGAGVGGEHAVAAFAHYRRLGHELQRSLQRGGVEARAQGRGPVPPRAQVPRPDQVRLPTTIQQESLRAGDMQYNACVELHDIYKACAPSAFRRARALLGCDDEAWDVVQRVFVKLTEGELRSRAGEKPMAYVYRATTNACLNVIAARGVRDRLLPEAPAERAPGEAVHARDLLRKLDAKLDDLDRQILVLSFHDGLSQERVGEILGVWRRTVGRRLARLRTLIEELEAMPLRKTP